MRWITRRSPISQYAPWCGSCHCSPDSRGDNMDGLGQDIRFALRSLGKAPGFVAIPIATLALGGGGKSPIFPIVNAVVLRPLPYAHADRLVRVTADVAGNAPDIGMSPPELFDYRDRADLFDDIAGI